MYITLTLAESLINTLKLFGNFMLLFLKITYLLIGLYNVFPILLQRPLHIRNIII